MPVLLATVTIEASSKSLGGKGDNTVTSKMFLKRFYSMKSRTAAQIRATKLEFENLVGKPHWDLG